MRICREPSAVEKETSLANFPASNNSWDIRSSYKTECQEIEGGWSPQGDPTWTLDLYLESRQGKQQLDGTLLFKVVEGVVRFEKPILVPKSESTSKKQKREVIGNISDVEMDMLPEYKGMKTQVVYTEKVTFLGAKDKPTARRLTWRYRWRGSETGEGEFQLDSDKNVQSNTLGKMAKMRSLAICEGLTGLHSLLARVRLCVKTNGTGMRRALRPLASLAAASNTLDGY
jgi:hypothetical protein